MCVFQIAEEFATNLEGRIKHYLRHVAYELEHNVGQCGPISNAYNATVVAACSKIVQPLVSNNHVNITIKNFMYCYSDIIRT